MNFDEVPCLPGFEDAEDEYVPRKPAYFDVQKIVLTRGCDRPDTLRRINRIAKLYPNAPVVERWDCSHNQAEAFADEADSDMLKLHQTGKKTLLFGTHRSSVRYSSEAENSCPNYWHYSTYGFCPYGCTYCYLAGTRSIRFAPAVKIFVNLDEILAKIHRTASNFTRPEAFYHGKLQDGLALDPLSGYTLKTIPFFARESFARQVILTKSTDVENLLGLEHNHHTALSWTLNLPDVQKSYDPDTPPMDARIQAMKRCAEAGYPVRAVLMPLILVTDYLDRYADFLRTLLKIVPLERLTLGSICSFPSALSLMNRKLSSDNEIAQNLELPIQASDGRARYPVALRKEMYEYLFSVVRSVRPDLEVGLCLESREMLTALGSLNFGKCNCIW